MLCHTQTPNMLHTYTVLLVYKRVYFLAATSIQLKIHRKKTKSEDKMLTYVACINISFGAFRAFFELF